MKTRNYLGDRDGVALVMVLGLLSVLTLLAIAFAIAMRVERLAARNYADGIRAEQLAQVGLTRAIEAIDASTQGKCYPGWNVMTSSNGVVMNPPDMLTGEASNAIPGSLLEPARAAAGQCKWEQISTSSRVAYVVLNCGGFYDANYVGGGTRPTWFRTNVDEITLSSLPDVKDYGKFVTNRLNHIRYETTTELAKLNKKALADPVQNFAVYSYDMGRDLVVSEEELKANKVGTRDIVLYPKFNVNGITNTPEYKNAASGGVVDQRAYYGGGTPGGSSQFKTWYTRLNKVLTDKGNTPGSPYPGAAVNYSDPAKWSDIGANIVSYLDPDRIPQLIVLSSKEYPWQVSEGYEDVPHINEVVLRKVEGVDASSNIYEFAIELWYPYYPNVVKPEDGFSLQVNVYPNEATASGWPLPAGDARWTFNVAIDNMSFYGNSGADQFKIITSPTDRRITFPGNAAIGGANIVCFIGVVMKKENGMDYPVDQAMTRTTATKFDSEHGYSVNDPRSNGKLSYWTTADDRGGLDYPAAQHTLGKRNTNSKPWAGNGVGLPIFHRDGPMESVGEIGHIWTGNVDDEISARDYWYWQGINIMNYDFGAFLLDRMTTRETPDTLATGQQGYNPVRGLVSINTTQTNVLKALFSEVPIGAPTNAPPQTLHATDAAVEILIKELLKSPNYPYWCFQSLFLDSVSGSGTAGIGHISDVEQKFRDLVTAKDPVTGESNEILRQDPLRKIINLLSFRHNLFEVIVAAQVIGKDGVTPIADRRGVATIYRDSYTSKAFIRSFKWLSD